MWTDTAVYIQTAVFSMVLEAEYDLQYEQICIEFFGHNIFTTLVN